MKFLTDNWIMARRQYAHMLAQPDEIAGTLLFPILMVVLFAYVFGSAIKLPGNANYREFLMPGIFMQVTAMSATVAAGQAAEDKVKGIIDRFKSMPIARSSVLLGRSLADLTLRLFGLAVMVAVRRRAGRLAHPPRRPADAAAAFGLLALFGFAMMWVGTTIGLSVSSAARRRRGHVRLALPADVPGQHVRADPGHAGLAATDRGLEPDERHGRRDPRALRQPDRLEPGRSPGRCSTRSACHSAGRCSSSRSSSRSPSAATGSPTPVEGTVSGGPSSRDQVHRVAAGARPVR